MEHLLQIAEGCGGFCTACFGGKYPTDVTNCGKKDRFEEKLHRKSEEDKAQQFDRGMCK